MSDIVWWEVVTAVPETFQRFHRAFSSWTFRPAFAETDLGGPYWIIEQEGVALGGLQGDDEAHVRMGARLYLETTDLEGALERAAALGAVVERRRTALGGSDRWFGTFRDPAGISWGLWTPTPPIAEFAFPGPLRDRLVAAILSGTKTSTSSLLHEYELDGDPLPAVGERSAVVDSAGEIVAVIEVTGVAVVALRDVHLQHALDEGEGYASVADWRAGHLRFWRSEAMRTELGDGFEVDDDTLVVLERFRVVG